jgi:simple sugar transport system permease protein
VTAIRELLRRAVIPALALITAFAIGAVIVVVTDFDHLKDLGTDPIGAIGGAIDVVVRGYGAIFTRAIGDPGRIVSAIQTGSDADIAKAIRPLTEALLSATPLIFVSLGLGVAFHAGLFNLGADGQFLIGGLGAIVGANWLDAAVPTPLLLVGALALGTVFGAAYGFVPGLLKARTGAHEVITTLMLNTIAAEIVFYVLRSGGFSRPLTSIATVPLIFDLPTVRLDWGFVVALLVAAVVSFLLFRTTLGFELRSTGFSRTAARAAGIRPGRSTVIAMSLSGGLAGMGGAFLTLGPAHGLAGFDGGFVTLALALLGGLRPSGIVVVALLYGALNNGAKSMVVETGVPLTLLDVIIALALMFVAAPGLTRMIWRRPAPTTPEMGPPVHLGAGDAL